MEPVRHDKQLHPLLHPLMLHPLMLHPLPHPLPHPNAPLHMQDEKYGLSFVKLISPPGSGQATPTDTPTLSDPSKSAPIKLGVFSLKEETKDLPPGSLFFRKTATSPPPESPAPNAAAQARMASAAALRAKTPPRTDKTPPRTSLVQQGYSGNERKSREDAGRKNATPTGRGHMPATKKARGKHYRLFVQGRHYC